MNPFQMWKLYRKVNTVTTLAQEATVKSIWKSRTLWFNLLSAVLEVAQLVAQYQLLPPGLSTLIVNLVNIALRMVTTEAVSVTGKG